MYLSPAQDVRATSHLSDRPLEAATVIVVMARQVPDTQTQAYYMAGHHLQNRPLTMLPSNPNPSPAHNQDPATPPQQSPTPSSSYTTPPSLLPR